MKSLGQIAHQVGIDTSTVAAWQRAAVKALAMPGVERDAANG